MKCFHLQMFPIILGFAAFFASPEYIRAAETVSESNIAAYLHLLEKLDARDWKTIPIARAEMEKRFSKSPDSTAVEAFRTFRNYYSLAAQTINRTYFWQTSGKKEYQAVLNAIMSVGNPGYIQELTPEVLNGDPMQILSSRDEAFRKRMEEKYRVALKDLRELRESGIRFYWGEGNWYAGEDAGYLAKAGDFLKGDYREYLHFQAETAKERIAEDAALMISWDELRKRIIRQEAFEKKHPSLQETKTEVGNGLQWLVTVYLSGIDNTRAYDLNFMNHGRSPGTGAIDPELRKSYERFLSENKDSKFHPLIEKICDILKRHDYTYSKELDLYLKEKGYGMFLGLYQGK